MEIPAQVSLSRISGDCSIGSVTFLRPQRDHEFDLGGLTAITLRVFAFALRNVRGTKKQHKAGVRKSSSTNGGNTCVKRYGLSLCWWRSCCWRIQLSLNRGSEASTVRIRIPCVRNAETTEATTRGTWASTSDTTNPPCSSIRTSQARVITTCIRLS